MLQREILLSLLGAAVPGKLEQDVKHLDMQSKMNMSKVFSPESPHQLAFAIVLDNNQLSWTTSTILKALLVP